MSRALKDRIAACLKGVAVGDAVGKQTEGLSRASILRWYPQGVRGFEGSPGTPMPRYVGKKYEWRFGETTDDTERTIAVATAILLDGAVRHAGVGRELLQCRKCVHPGVQSLWEFHQAADPARVAIRHDGCGAAIRMAPVGIVHSSRDLETLVGAAREASISTHGGPLALAAAAAAAAAISAAVDGASGSEIIRLAQDAAALSECETSGAGARSIADAIAIACSALRQRPHLDADAIAGRVFPDRPLTIVPLALALGAIADSADAAILLAANIGGDSDSVASIAGAVAGAREPQSINEEWYAAVERTNGHRLVALADALCALRRRAVGGPETAA